MKILNKLTIKHLKQNPRRTIVTIIGVMLSTSLMVGIGLLFSSVRDMSIQLIEEESGRHHVQLEVPADKIEIISKNKNIKEYYYDFNLGYAEYNDTNNFYKPYIHILSASDGYLNSLNLLEGRLPKADNELIISEYMSYSETKLKVGDKIKLDVGTRVDEDLNPVTGDLLISEFGDEPIRMEKIANSTSKEYTIVGIIERDVNETYYDPGYRTFTNGGTSDIYNVYIIFNKIKKTYDNTDTIATNLGYDMEEDSEKIIYNTDLLSVNGVTKYENIASSLGVIICIILSLISIACIIVIYNSFAISVMERKKQFGLFSSIGATKKQLRHTVFYEAFIIGLIGIPLGILAAYVGIGVVIYIINHLLLDVLGIVELNLVTYPLFIIIPIIFMIITILISAFIPAKMASKVSPIEAIRQNDDIKIKTKKVKSPKIIRTLFGIEGDIAYKNMKRNKKKYRTTIISLFISIVLFITFNVFVEYGLEGSADLVHMPEYEYTIQVMGKEKDDTEVNEVVNKLSNMDGIKKRTIMRSLVLKNNDLNYKLSNEISDNNIELYEESYKYTSIYSLDNDSYNKYLKELGLKNERPIVINRYKFTSYESGRKSKNIKIFDEVNNYSVSFYDYETLESYDKQYKFENIYLADKMPMGIDTGDVSDVIMIVSESMFNEIYNDENNTNITPKTIFLIASNYTEITKAAEEVDSDDVYIYTYNIKEERQLVSNLLLVLKILLYGFISLVTLIGVTSVLNTINTSIALRRKEFAVLRSIGLTPKGFNKMLFFESLFFGLKSLLYGIPVSIIIVRLLYATITDVVEFTGFMIPYTSILIATIGVFIIVMISMRYASRKVKKENILDAIREENI